MMEHHELLEETQVTRCRRRHTILLTSTTTTSTATSTSTTFTLPSAV